MDQKIPSQPTRLLIVGLYVLVLISASFLAMGTWPPLSARGLWFYTGIISLVLGDLLITPFFATPKDAIANVFVAGLALVAANSWNSWDNWSKTVFVLALVLLAIIMLLAIGTILLKDVKNKTAQLWAGSLKILSEQLGNQRTVFSIVIIAAVCLFHLQSSRETLIVMMAWAIVVAIKPDRNLMRI